MIPNPQHGHGGETKSTMQFSRTSSLEVDFFLLEMRCQRVRQRGGLRGRETLRPAGCRKACLDSAVSRGDQGRRPEDCCRNKTSLSAPLLSLKHQVLSAFCVQERCQCGTPDGGQCGPWSVADAWVQYSLSSPGGFSRNLGQGSGTRDISLQVTVGSLSSSHPRPRGHPALLSVLLIYRGADGPCPMVHHHPAHHPGLLGVPRRSRVYPICL